MNKNLLSTCRCCILLFFCLAGLGVSAQTNVKAQETQHQNAPKQPAQTITKPAKSDAAPVAPAVPKLSVPVQHSEKAVSQPQPALQPATGSHRTLIWKR